MADLPMEFTSRMDCNTGEYDGDASSLIHHDDDIHTEHGSQSECGYVPTTPPESEQENLQETHFATGGEIKPSDAPDSSACVVIEDSGSDADVAASASTMPPPAVAPKQEIMDEPGEPDGGDVPINKRTRSEEEEIDPSFHKKVFSTPDILKSLSPPGCTITLAFTDHRFKATWKKHIKCELWIDELSNASFSSSFTSQSWKDSLCLVHANAWEKWFIAQDSVSELKLPKGVHSQEPGVIDDRVYNQLAPVIATMPAPKVYGKRSM